MLAVDYGRFPFCSFLACRLLCLCVFFFFQAEDGIRDTSVTGVQTCALPILTVKQSYGPDQVTHYNGYPSADINGSSGPGVSSGEAVQAMERLAAETLPNGVGYEWTELTYQQKLAGNTAIFVFPLCVLLVFLVLAAQYESWSLPLVIILIVPMCLLSAIGGVWLTRGDSNVFTQIGLLVLVGLACKNAILIVEFARDLERQGRDRLTAALEASRIRLRPTLMTSFAFIMGVVPLVIAPGAGAEMRRVMGIAVFSGMLGVTFFGLAFTPLFYVLIRGLVAKRTVVRAPESGDIQPLRPWRPSLAAGNDGGLHA